ncbi:MAG: zinc dependent phospholipase C family protein [Lachnospiraceae bacterium]|nr:zinc dependent phospholipase C family protein [Lachnospiraceae bacterium]
MGKGKIRMPATYAHYLFGKKVYRKLPKELRLLIRNNREGYFLGLHGPDLLFYYRPLGKNRINQMGSLMHHELASDFFENSRGVYQQHPKPVLLSYLLGFICHFTLDSECHPYISRYMENYGVSHSDIETELDRALMEKEGKDPRTWNYTWHLRGNRQTQEAIASVLKGVTVRQVDESIREFSWVIRFFQGPGQKKEHLLRFLFGLIGQRAYFGGMLMTGRTHIKCEASNSFLEQRLEDAVETAVALIEEYTDKIETQQALSRRFMRDFE